MLKSNAEKPVIGTLDQREHFVISDDGELTALSDAGKEIAENCTEFHVVIPDGVTSIKSATRTDSVFWKYRAALKSVILPDGLTTIGEYAFYECSGLTSIELSDTLTTIGNYAFYGCSGLTSVKLPATVTDINTSTSPRSFYGCTSLTSIDLSQTKITAIPDYYFQYLSNLTSIELPDTLTTIGNSAFYRCTSLTSIELPDTLTTIGGYAFYSCTSFTSIELPGTLTTIGNLAFNCGDGPFDNYGYGKLAVLICPDAEVVDNYKNGILQSYADKLAYQIGWQINLTDHNGEQSVIAEKTLVGENFANWHYVDGAWVEDPDYVATELQELPALPDGWVWEDDDGNELTVEIVKDRIAAAQDAGSSLTINAKAVGDPIIDEPEPVDPTPDQPENPDDDDDQTPSGSSLPWWIWLAIGGGVVGLGGITTAVVFMIKKKALKI